MKLPICRYPMMSSIVYLFLCSNLWAVPQTETEINFKNDIQPIFENHCLRCHGPETEEGFRIDDKEAALDYITPGEPEESEIYTYLVTDDEEELMPPPDEGGPLGDSDVQLVKRWIAQGAAWPDDVQWGTGAEVETEPVSESGLADKPPVGKTPVTKPGEPDIYRAIGSLHPAMIHLPLGLLFASGLFALLSLRGSFVMSDCSYYCLWLGTLGAILACVSGWWFAPMENSAWQVESLEDLTNVDSKIFFHRTSGLIVTAAALLLALYASGSRNRNPDDGVLWKLGTLVLAAGIGYVGHEGGELTWNRDGKHYRDLDGIIEKYIPIFSDAEKETPAKRAPVGQVTDAENGTEATSPSVSPKIGETSGETSSSDPNGSQPEPGLQK